MSQQEHKVENFFSSFAPQWDTLYGEKRNALWRLFDATFRRDVYDRYAFTFETIGKDARGKTVLDAGCGNGIYCLEAARRGADRVLGVDVAPGMVQIASQSAQQEGFADRCKFQVGQFPDAAPEITKQGPFDYLILTGVLDYIQKPGEFLRALRPLVKGKLIASVPGRQQLRYLVRRTRYKWSGRPDVYCYSREEVERMFAEGGFKITKLTYWTHSGGCYMVVGE
jgi:2-polyprenyl-3-methyl-5-hydroxy-6-metoxy-1,4-benzoquinol methylase